MNGFSGAPGVIYDQKLFNRDVRRDIRNCVLFIALFYIINIAASGIVMAAHMLSNPSLVSSIENAAAGSGFFGSGGPSDIASAVESAANGQTTGLMSIVGIVAGGCVFLFLRKKRFFTDLALPAAEKLTPMIFIILVVISQAIQVVYGLIISLIDYVMPGGLSITDSYESLFESLYTPVGLLYIILIGPIFEELIFRGAIMGVLRRFGANFAILFSALLFGFYHMTIMQIPFGFVMGLLLGYAASRWSLRASIALHIIVNGLSALLSMQAGNAVFAGAAGFVMLACVIATVIMAISWRGTLGARIRGGAAYYENTYRYGFSSIAFWVYIAVTATVGVLMLNSPGLTF